MIERERIATLTDGVFAIILTLFVFNIDIEHWEGPFIKHLLTSILIYAICFIHIAVMWLSHHHLWLYVENAGRRLVWLNFITLFFISLTPVSGKLLLINGGDLISFQFFSLNMMACSIGFTLIQFEANKSTFTESKEITRKLNTINITTTLSYTIGAIVATYSLWICIAILVLFPIIYAMQSPVNYSQSLKDKPRMRKSIFSFLKRNK